MTSQDGGARFQVAPETFDAIYDGSRATESVRRERLDEVRELRELSRPFRTEAQLAKLAAAPQGDRVRFTVIGDSEPGEFWFIRALNARGRGMYQKLMRRTGESEDFIAQLGDMVSRGTIRNFLSFFRTLSSLAPRAPYLTIPGNHDRSTPRAKRVGNDQLYRWLFGPTDYFFDRAGVRFVFLNNSARRLTPEQLSWLDSAVSAGPEQGIRRKVVFAHIPPAPISEWADFRRLKNMGGFKEGADEFMNILSRRGVSLLPIVSNLLLL